MRVLMIHPRLPSSYWSLEQLCRIGGWRTLLPPLGLPTVAALLPPEWSVRLVDENARPLREADWQWADLVMVSGMLLQQAALLALIRQAKARGKVVAAGGPATSSLAPAMLEAGCDVVMRGEVENLMPAFLAALAGGRTGTVVEAPVRPDLASSPVPRFELLGMRDYGVMAIQTSRGCPHDCEFCDVVSLLGRTPRHKSPDQVIAELDVLHRLGWRGEIFICDDNFIGNPAHARAILKRVIPWMKQHDEPFVFWTQASIRLGTDRELIDLMTAANFSTVFVGIESLDDAALKLAGKRQNVRNSMTESVRAMTANGLTVVGSLVLGLDGEAPGAGTRIAAFVEATQIPVVMLNLLAPLPNTRLWHRLAREGRLPDRAANARDEGETLGYRMRFVPTRPPAEILSEYRELWAKLLDPVSYLTRAYRYFLSMRPTRAAASRAKGADRPHNRPHRRLPFGRVLVDTWRLGRLSWRLGVIAPCRRLYWTQLVGMFRRNPSRLVRYLSTLALGLDMFAVRNTMLRRVDATLREVGG
jgi:radical SAM superfamily enzyme YgiQ (UPF0313 family)